MPHNKHYLYLFLNNTYKIPILYVISMKYVLFLFIYLHYNKKYGGLNVFNCHEINNFINKVNKIQLTSFNLFSILEWHVTQRFIQISDITTVQWEHFNIQTNFDAL